MQIHDIKDIIHVGQQSYSSLRNILGSHNFEVLSNVIIDIRILANYCLSSELVDLLGEYRDAEEAGPTFITTRLPSNDTLIGNTLANTVKSIARLYE
jgi:hypothetical protein